MPLGPCVFVMVAFPTFDLVVILVPRFPCRMVVLVPDDLFAM